MRKSTFGWLAAGLVLLTAVVGAFVVPAGVAAKTQDTIVLRPNQTVELTKPGLPPVGYAYGRAKDVGDYDPEHCGDGGTGEAICDYFPIRVDLTPQEKANNVYLLLINVDWPGENYSVPAVIVAALPQLTLNVWEDPIVPDEEPVPPCENPELAPGVPDVAGATCPAPDEEKPGGDEPLYASSIGDPKPLRWGTLISKFTTFSAIITNYAGANDEYTLTVELVEVEGVPDLSIDEEIQDLSAPGADGAPITPSSTFDGFSNPAADAVAAPSVLDLADLGADSQLDRLGIQGDDALGFDADAQEILARRNIRDIRPPGDEDTWALLLWLVAVPVGAAGFAVYWGLRRRASLFASI
jgi:hypothetical protein